MGRRLSRRLVGGRTDGEGTTDGDRADAPATGPSGEGDRAGSSSAAATGEGAVLDESHRDDDASGVKYDPGEIEDRADVVAELGLEPEAFVVRLLEELGGRVPQQAFTEYTDWSESTISRVLQALEDDGEIVRVQVGRENLVSLPEETPTGESSPSPDRGDSST